MSSSTKRRVCYFYDSDVGNYYYGQGHPMKPHRIRMTHNLLINYGLYQQMQIYVRAHLHCPAHRFKRPPRCGDKEMTKFHADEYVNFLRQITPDNMEEHSRQLQRCTCTFTVSDSQPDSQCRRITRYSRLLLHLIAVGGAVKLNNNDADIAVNWAGTIVLGTHSHQESGGLHHAKKSEASGFCYVNDIVLAILELLKHHQRVLYIDIDIHHGDGVEEAFYTTDRVMCVSFHKFGEYFPGTGDLKDVGSQKGKYYSVNFPMKDGIDDESYQSVFKPILTRVMEWYRPGAIVLQCGADSLAGDRLGCFNLSLKGHAECVAFMKTFGLPLLVLGGGGYTIRNVARCWTYETALLLDAKIEDDLPFHDYIDYYAPDYRLHIVPSNMENLNSREYLEKCRNRIIDNLRHMSGAPSVQLGTDLPPDALHSENDDDDEQDPDLRPGRDLSRRLPENELSDSDDEDDRRHDGAEEGQHERLHLAAFKKELEEAEDEEVELDERERANGGAVPALEVPAATTAVGLVLEPADAKVTSMDTK